MLADKEHIKDLLQKHLAGEGSDAEFRQLLEIIHENPDDADWDNLIVPGLLAAANNPAPYEAHSWEPVIHGILSRKELSQPVHRIHLLRTAWFRYAAAVLIVVGIGAYLWSANRKEQSSVDKARPVVASTDILPGHNRAVLTLSDGRKVQLDSAASESIEDGILSIRNTDGQLIYSGLSPAGGSGGALSDREQNKDRRDAEGVPISFNTMTTPKGGQYQLTLSDGTKLWLNAASSVTYPTVFAGKTREVTVSGEAYFEVKKDASRPFIVKTTKEQITVMGTEFNVNAYADEQGIKTSLVEGSVKIGEKILQPGQAYMNGNMTRTNVRQDVAWKNGVFDFHKMPLEKAMRQIARWYDLTIVYKSHPPIVVGGTMGRDLSLQQVLKILSSMGLKYELKGRVLEIQ